VTPLDYQSMPRRVKVLVWPQATQADIEALIGEENVNAVSSSNVQIRNSDDEWVTLCHGWFVVAGADGTRHAASASALVDMFQPAQPVTRYADDLLTADEHGKQP
jgi:hypothetical protein